jgi:hypothetical protein
MGRTAPGKLESRPESVNRSYRPMGRYRNSRRRVAYGIGSGADMLKPLAIAVIGALFISVLLSLVATPTVYFTLMRLSKRG